MCVGAALLAIASSAQAPGAHSYRGVWAALGAGVLWGTMYIPYRKAYLSGMNPLAFITMFTFGELGTVLAIALFFEGGGRHLATELAGARTGLFWLFLAGFVWVLGDLFQNYAVKYIGIGRGIPLSNTNQLWGLAWGVLVFGETSGARILPIAAGSLIMAAGAWVISRAVAPEREHEAWSKAAERERLRYGFDPKNLDHAGHPARRSWWELGIIAIAIAIFVWLASLARKQPLSINGVWTGVILVATIAILALAARVLWKHARFG